MPKIKIDRERCKGCYLCILYCQKQCIKEDGAINKRGVHPVMFLDSSGKCTGCSFCAIMCPEVCIEVSK